MATDFNAPLALSPVRPDYDALYEQFERDLLENPAWNNFATSGTGSALLRFISSVGAYNQNGIARALQEGMLDTARVPTSVFRIMRMLGVHIQRRISGEMEVAVTRIDTSLALTIPKRTVWMFNSTKFYNPTDVTFLAGQSSRSVTLLQGEPVTTTINSSGVDYQRFATDQFAQVADQGIWAVDAQLNEWTAIRDGLWNHEPNERVFQETTLPDGRVEFWFGNGYYGARLPVGPATLGWIRAASALETSTPIAVGTQGAPIGYAATAVVTTASAPNEDEQSVDFYKIMGPKIHAAFDNAVTRDDYAAIAVQYPGVLDAVFRGQAELNPSDLRFMNIIAATLLTTSPWTTQQFDRFKRYMEEEKGIATTTVIRSDPEAVPVDVTMEVRAFNRADLEEVDKLTRSVIADFFKVRFGSLGASYFPSDLTINVMQKCADDLGTLIDYVTVAQPAESVELGRTQYATLRNVTLTVLYTDRTPNATYAVRMTGL